MSGIRIAPPLRPCLILLLLSFLGVACSGGQGLPPTLTASVQPTSLPSQSPTLPQATLVSPPPPSVTATPEDSFAVQAQALLPQAHDVLGRLADAPRYTLMVDIDYDRRAFRGSAQITLTNQEDAPLDRLYFRLYPNGGKSYGDGFLQVSAVSVDGAPVETSLSDSNTVLLVELSAPLQVRQRTQIAMEFQGQVAEGFGDPDDPQGYGIYTFSQGVLSMSGWYPLLAVYDQDGWNLDPVSDLGDSVYSDAAFYDVWVSADADLVVVATGSRIAREQNGDALRQRFVSGPARDFYLVMSPAFAVASQDVGRTQVNSYYLPEHAQGGEAALSVAAAALEVYNRRFGLYPYKELDVVDASMQNALGVEYPGVFLVASGLYEDPAQDAFLITTSHETAHQWWYNIVGNDVFDAPWLDEALATFSSALYYQEQFGQVAYQGYIDYLQQRVDVLRQNGQDAVVNRSLAYFESLGEPGIYGRVVYNKGALFFITLREEIGDAAFFDALQDYYRKYQFQVGEASGLLDAFEASAGRQLDDIYREWLDIAD